MDLQNQRTTGNSAAIFLAGVLIGGIGGGLAGWLLGGHIAPILSGIINLIARDSKQESVRFEALQQ